MPTKQRLLQMKKEKEQQKKLRRKAKLMSMILFLIFYVAIIGYAKINKPETIKAQIVGVEYNKGNTTLYAELPDGNVEVWDLDYCVYNLPSEIEIRLDNHEIYDYPQ